MDGMDMSDTSSTTMSHTGMQMTFFSATNTPLYSTAWTPSTTGAYAGTCIFLILLSVLLRFLSATKSHLESRWRRKNLGRKYIVTAEDSRARRESSYDDEQAKERAVLTVNGLDERVRLVEYARSKPTGAAVQPFRLSVDLVRAAFVTVMVGVAYLLMLAVMTFNVGYFMSVLGGVFLGELLFGRWSTHADLEHH